MPLVLLAAVALLLSAFSARAQPPASSPSLDFEFFELRVQPVFTTKRPGNARCVTCHAFGTPMRLQPLAPGSATWTEEQSRKNFDVIRLRVVPGNPAASRLLRHPLAESAGGDPQHDGGKHWTSKDDPEWQTLAAWVRGETLHSAAPVRGNGSNHPDEQCGRQRAYHRPADEHGRWSDHRHRGWPWGGGGAGRQPALLQQRS